MVWGSGHIALGDRRGWLLLALQPLAVATVLLLAAQLVDGTSWLVVFPPLALLLAVWVGQAIHAHARAVQLGGAPGGELQVALFLPLAVGALTLFWLVGGRHGSPAATVQAYIEAWVDRRPEAARDLFVERADSAAVSAEWQQHMDRLTGIIEHARATYGLGSRLDTQRPFDSLRVRELDANAERTGFAVEVVRSRRIETTLLGIIPTAGQETVVVEPALYIWLTLEQQPPQFGLRMPGLESYVWKIERLEVPAGEPS